MDSEFICEECGILMDFQKVEVFDGGVRLKEVKNFELSHVFDCGQCFRWNRQEDGGYIGIAYGRVLKVKKENNDLLLYNCSLEDFNNIWLEYFDLYRDYSAIKEDLSKDPILQKSVQFGNGIRILKQESFEIIISFIISANNRIPMIKRAIERISAKWGDPIDYNGSTYYTFPNAASLIEASEKEFEEIGVGFRAKYIKDTVDKICKGDEFCNFNLGYIKGLKDDECNDQLQEFCGVGPKVADCIMLFSMQKYSAFPVDVWVKRAMMHFYMAPDVSLKKIRDFARNKFGELSGFAQQYLFYYARENNIKIE